MRRISYRRRADLVLAAVFGLFALAVFIRHLYPHSLPVRVLLFVGEAALVGGIADWFAVTALFRKPLGFAWHTALIPRSRDKIIAALAGAVQNELLSKESIKQRLSGIRLVDALINWLETGGRAERLYGLAGRYAQTAWDSLDPRAVARAGQKWLKAILHETGLGKPLGQAITWALKSGRADRFIDDALAQVFAAVARDETRQAIHNQLVKYKESASKTRWQRLALSLAEATNTLNLDEAAVVLQSELLVLLQDLAEADHPVRTWIRLRLADLPARLENDPAWAEGIAAWQKGLAGRLQLEEALIALADLTKTSLGPGDPAAWAACQAEKMWTAFKEDTKRQAWAEEQLHTALGSFIDSEHDLVAAVVRNALASLDDEALNRFIEDKCGEDLAWIRINGSVVGGVVGLLLFLFLYYIYNPYILPVVRSWMAG
jgi:uncharacterized membrane-anchored protein YjiN (DUF445 family)